MSILLWHQAEVLTLAYSYTTASPGGGSRTCPSPLCYLATHIPALAFCKEP